MLRVLRTFGLTVLLAGMSLPAAPSASADTQTSVGGGTGIVFQLTPSPEAPTSYKVCPLTAIGRDATGDLVGLTNAHCLIDEQGDKLVGNAWGAQHSSPILSFADETDANGGVGAGFHLTT